MIRVEIPLAPSVNRLWRATKGGKVYRSSEYTNWLTEASWMIKSQTKDKIIGQYILHIAAVKPDKRHRDLDNLLKATCDLLVKTNIVESDSMCRALAAEWVEFGAPMTLTIYGLEEEIEEWKIPKHMVN